ncbi:Hint domain-containing protein [Acetobacter sp.]|uniref:Hint domain-containing protein n=1 Tax=Acetobacter sp. TaxID=440 RepID=UPI0025C5B133|nr:Hint domain-containing protein [Acetobacter sp.]MCH4090508.1 Hint domain-containing protein [Acetobacter sp.]MCI1299202.1 Hint domain-containing protein [Acetobacter sp.]MCI1315749.1 Hint domain-containing protein [Acetobacter sp.]
MTTSSSFSDTDSFVLSGQTSTVSSGTIASAVTVLGGGILIVDGVANGTRLQGTTAGQAQEIVQSGGTEQNVTVLSGTVKVLNEGLLNTGIALAGGTIELASGAVADTLVAGSRGTVTISSAEVTSVTFAGGTLNVTDARVPVQAVSSGTLVLGSSTSAAGLRTGASGTLILNGGSASGTVISGASALEQILAPAGSGGVAEQNFLILDGGSQQVGNGTVENGTIASGGSQTLQSGTSARQVIIASGGTQTVASGSVAVNDIVEAGGFVTNDGTLIFEGQSSIAGQISGAGAISQTGSGTTLQFTSGALEHFSGTIALSGGTVMVADGDEASHVQFLFSTSGGESLVLGSVPTSLTLSGFGANDSVFLSGVTSGTSLSLGTGSQLTLESGGSALETIFLDSGTDYSGANLTLVENADGTGATLSFGGAVSPHIDTIIANGDVGIVVATDETALIPTASFGINTVVQAGGRLYVDGLGLQNEVHGTEVVASGGRVAQTRLYGSEEVLTGGVASATSIVGGTQSILGGTATGTTITGRYNANNLGPDMMIDGTQIVGSGGLASDTTVNVTFAGNTYLPLGQAISDSVQYVENGGTAIDTTLTGLHLGWLYHTTPLWADGYAQQIVMSGGTAINTTANANATIDVQAGGSATNISLDGGTLTLEKGALYTGTLTFLPNCDPGYTVYGMSGSHTTQSVLNVTMDQLASITIQGFDVIGSVITMGLTSLYSPSGTQTVSTINQIVITDLTFAGTANEIDTGFIGADGVLTVTEGNESVSIHLGGTFGSPFYFQRAPDGGTRITYGVPCYCPGTLISTPDGERAIETLSIGDIIQTASGESRAIRWIGRRSYDGRFAEGNPDILPVVIQVGALGNGLPRRTLRVSPLHAMALDGKLIPASLLINGSSITQTRRPRRVDYIHIELDTHDLLLAEGAASETFVDDDSRSMFHNVTEYETLYPDEERQAAHFCLPRIEDGPQLEAIRLRLKALAADVMERSRVHGFVDAITATTIEGWARCDAVSDTPRELIIYSRDIELGRVTADRFRADLTENGHHSGKHAFCFTCEVPVVAGLIRVEDADTGDCLTNPAASGSLHDHAA